MLKGRRPTEATEAGFTLIELLVVLIILGILTAVVVLAVAGIGAQSQTTGEKADFATIAKAEEAYFATVVSAGKYTDEAGLVPKFLAEPSTLHDICLSPNKRAYKIVKQVALPGDSCAGVSVPNP